jgi:hypothetical protein
MRASLAPAAYRHQSLRPPPMLPKWLRRPGPHRQTKTQRKALIGDQPSIGVVLLLIVIRQFYYGAHASACTAIAAASLAEQQLPSCMLLITP